MDNTYTVLATEYHTPELVLVKAINLKPGTTTENADYAVLCFYKRHAPKVGEKIKVTAVPA